MGSLFPHWHSNPRRPVNPSQHPPPESNGDGILVNARLEASEDRGAAIFWSDSEPKMPKVCEGGRRRRPWPSRWSQGNHIVAGGLPLGLRGRSRRRYIVRLAFNASFRLDSGGCSETATRAPSTSPTRRWTVGGRLLIRHCPRCSLQAVT